MKRIIGMTLGLMMSAATFAGEPTDISTWGDMTGKVKNVNVEDYKFTVEGGVGTVTYTAEKGANTFGAPGIEFDPAPFKGKKLKFSAQIKTKDARYSSIWLRVDGKDSMLAFDNGADRFLEGTNNWTNFEIVLPVREDSTRILAGMLHGASGEMSVRNLSFKVTEDEITSDYASKTTFSLNVKDWALSKSDDALFKGEASNGVASIESTNKSVSADAYAVWRESFRPEQFFGHRVRFSAEIKTQDVSDGFAGLWMRVDGKGDTDRFDNMSDRGIKGDSDWQTYSVVLDVTDKTVYNLSFGMLLSGAGKAWIRNASLTSVSKEVKTTK